MGTAAISDGDYVHVAINHADLIIMVGHDVVEKPPFFMHPKDTRKVLSLSLPNHACWQTLCLEAWARLRNAGALLIPGNLAGFKRVLSLLIVNAKSCLIL